MESDIFSDDAFRYPLFAGDPEALHTKLSGSSGLLGDYWADFTENVMTDDESRAAMVYLPALLGDDEATVEAASGLRNYYRDLKTCDTDNAVQFHTWCRCGGVTRRAAYFDWLAHRGVWSREEIDEAADSFLRYAFKHPYAVLNARTRASDNQAWSMCLNCAVLGFLFGHKLTNHPMGKFLFDYGMGRLPDLIGLFPADGYGGEGSTYTSHVNTPLAYWTTAFLHQLTGKNYLDVPFSPNETTLRRLLEIEVRLMGPTGLLAPWDHYGWQKEHNASPFSFLASVTGDPRYLSLIGALDLWPGRGMLAWGNDDPLWTLVWWPDEFEDYDDTSLPGDRFGWFLPRTGAALDDTTHRTRLMQVWDRCAETFSAMGRAQTNPNHLIFENDGEPVFQDGVPVKGEDPWGYPPEKVLSNLTEDERERYVAYRSSINYSDEEKQDMLAKVARGGAAGLVGSANCIVIDDEPWYWPRGARTGTPHFYGHNDRLQVVSADCAEYYQPAYDVSRMRRTSAWTDAGIGVVVDDLAAESSHMWQWQVYLRPDVDVAADQATINLPDSPNVLLSWHPGPDVSTELVEDFPKTQEQKSHRLELRSDGRAARYGIVIAPGAGQASVDSLTDDSIEVSVDGQKHRFEFTEDQCRWITAEQPEPVTVENEVSGAVDPDVDRLPDIKEERNLQRREIKRMVEWTSDGVTDDEGQLSRIDNCLAQIVVDEPCVELLLEALEAAHWPVQVAAAEALGQINCQKSTDRLRRLLAAEHAIPEKELYPPQESSDDEMEVEEKGKRWRLKAALIRALGRLRDEESVKLFAQIIRDGRDFYPVYSEAARALGRIGGPEAREALEMAMAETEANTHARARDAMAELGTSS